MTRMSRGAWLAMCLVGGLTWSAGAMALPTTELADAAMRSDADAVEALLARGVDVNEAQGDGMTALHWASLKGNEGLVRRLLSAGADVHARTRIGIQTPLHLASKVGHAAVMELLLRAGAEVDAPTAARTTPLMLAAAAGPRDGVRVLLANGADVNARESAKGHTALMFAAAANRAAAITALLEGGGDTEAKTVVFDLMEVAIPADRTAANNASTLDRRAEVDPNRPPPVPGVDRGWTYNELVAAQGGLAPLHFAAREGHIESVEALVKGGADVDGLSGGINATPLVFAIVNGRFDVAMHLLDKGADPNLAAENGVAPLYAVLNCQWSPKAQYPQPQAYLQQRTSYLALLEALLEAGADPNMRLRKKVWYSGYTQDVSGWDEAGATPFWRAAYAGDVEAGRLLLAHGADPFVPTMARRQSGAAGHPPLPAGGPGATPLHAAAGVGYLQSYAGNGHRRHPVGWMSAVQYLVEELRADVNERDNQGNTPLHYAAARGDNQMVRYLVSRGGDVTLVNRSGQTTVDAANGPRQRVSPFPETIKLLEGLGAKNNHKCVSC